MWGVGEARVLDDIACELATGEAPPEDPNRNSAVFIPKGGYHEDNEFRSIALMPCAAELFAAVANIALSM